jgi:hypothetical protein
MSKIEIQGILGLFGSSSCDFFIIWDVVLSFVLTQNERTKEKVKTDEKYGLKTLEILLLSRGRHIFALFGVCKELSYLVFRLTPSDAFL